MVIPLASFKTILSPSAGLTRLRPSTVTPLAVIVIVPVSVGLASAAACRVIEFVLILRFLHNYQQKPLEYYFTCIFNRSLNGCVPFLFICIINISTVAPSTSMFASNSLEITVVSAGAAMATEPIINTNATASANTNGNLFFHFALPPNKFYFFLN